MLQIPKENYEDFINDILAIYNKYTTEPQYYPEYLEEDFAVTMEKWRKMSNDRYRVSN